MNNLSPKLHFSGKISDIDKTFQIFFTFFQCVFKEREKITNSFLFDFPPFFHVSVKFFHLLNKFLWSHYVYRVWVVFQIQQLTYDIECRSSSGPPWISTSLILSSDEGMDTLTGDSLESDLVVSWFSWALFNSLRRGFKIGRALFCWCIIIKIYIHIWNCGLPITYYIGLRKQRLWFFPPSWYVAIVVHNFWSWCCLKKNVFKNLINQLHNFDYWHFKNACNVTVKKEPFFPSLWGYWIVLTIYLKIQPGFFW